MNSLTHQLLQRNIPVNPYSLLPGTTPIGETVIIDQAEITFRQEGAHLTIIQYRQRDRSVGLGNAFAQMQWLIQLIRTHVPEITTLHTTAMNVADDAYWPVPSPEKLSWFYKRYFNAVEDGYRDGQLWLKLEL